MSKLDVSLGDLIEKEKKRKGPRAGGAQRGSSQQRRGGGAIGGGRRGGGQQRQQERRQGGGVERGARRTRGQRSAPYAKGNPDDFWSHDLYNEAEEGNRRGNRDLGNTGFLKRSLSGGQGSDKATVEITGLSYEVTKEELQTLLSDVGDLLKVNIFYDRSGRSEGRAKAVFASREAANKAVREFDGAELVGETISLAIVANGAARGNKRGGGGQSVGGTFQVSTRGGRKVISRVRPADDRAFII